MSGHPPSLRDLLKAHDPARGQEELSGDDRIRMRRTLVQAAGAAAARPLFPRWAVAGVLAALAIGAGLGFWMRQMPAPGPLPPGAAMVPGSTGHSRREVHIVTPGGTQVVWVLDSDFRL
jgi:hypothetical protein